VDALMATLMTALRHLLEAPPLLPALTVMHWGWRLAWALVLGAGVLGLGQAVGASGPGFGRLRRFAGPALAVAALAVMLLALWPGPASPAHWLALAFQSPSLLSAVVCARFLWIATAPSLAAPMSMPQWSNGAGRSGACLGLAALGSLLGWLLLGDTLAWWLPSVYAWGFSPAALMTALGLLFILLWLGQHSAALQRFGALLALVLALFVFTRLPTGNLWDAVLDPWLWVVLQLMLLRGVWRRAVG